MPGLRLSPLTRLRRTPTAPETPVAPFTSRATIRITSVYGTSWRASHGGAGDTSLVNSLSFGRLERFYRASADQLPTVLLSQPIDTATVRCQRWHEGKLMGGRLWLFAMPSGQVVVALTLDIDCTHLQAVNLLEDCYYLDLTIGDATVEALAASEARARGIEIDSEEFAPERHQIVYSAALRVKDPADVVQRLIYGPTSPTDPSTPTSPTPGS